MAAFPSMLANTALPVTGGVKPILEQVLPYVTLDNWKLTALEVTYEPSEVDRPHRHPGFVFGYVVEGTLRFQVDGQKEVTYNVGQMFYEAPDSVHRVSANGSSTQPCRFLAMIFAPLGSPLSVQV